MTQFSQELESLGGQSPEANNPAPSSNEISLAVQEGIHQARANEERARKEAAYERRLQEQKAIQDREQAAIQEATEPVIASLKKEMSNNKDFENLIHDNQDFPETLIQYCAEVGDPDEAPAIIRELATNEEYRRKLERTSSEVGKKKLIAKIRKDILTGGTQGKVPPMLQKSIPQFNPNNSNQAASSNSFYRDVAARHGI